MTSHNRANVRKLLGLIGLLVAQCGLYAWLFALSSDFAYETPLQQRPILLVLANLGLCFVLHLTSLMIALRSSPSYLLSFAIAAGSLAFRLIVLFSEPIQEVDIYRYCWDGVVLRNAVSPFRYSPARVLTASESEPGLSDELQRLLLIRNRDPELTNLLSRVHFAELTTIYPPVSQLVFGAADLLTPAGATVKSRLTMMKAVIVVFDLFTLALLARLLAMVGRHPGWLIAYGWCPLVIKEFANSGHLDSIAVFFTVASVLCMTHVVLGGLHADRRAASTPRSIRGWSFSAAILLALGTGAKLYSIVLAPLFAMAVLRRMGWRTAVVWCGCYASLSILVLIPMVVEMRTTAADAVPTVHRAAVIDDHGPPPPPSLTQAAEAGMSVDSVLHPLPSSVDPSAVELAYSPADEDSNTAHEVQRNQDGLTEFLARWEMNDFLFMLLEENLRGVPNARTTPWFVIVGASQRADLCRCIAGWSGLSEPRVPFVVTRLVTLVLFALLAIGFAAWANFADRQDGDAVRLLEASFLTIAWFWLLSPTQNPWYWIWALPLIPFAGGRIWLAMSGLVVIYYLRFWITYHLDGVDIWRTGHVGTEFFDFVVVWFEYAPWLLVLFAAYLLRRRNSSA